jgi:hypothetical protein
MSQRTIRIVAIVCAVALGLLAVAELLSIIAR